MHAPLLAGGFAPAALVAQPEPLPHTVRVERATQLSAQGCLATPAELAVAMVRRLQRRRVADISRLRGGASCWSSRRVVDWWVGGRVGNNRWSANTCRKESTTNNFSPIMCMC